MKSKNLGTPAEIVRQHQRAERCGEHRPAPPKGDIDDFIFRGEPVKHCSER